jgi:hypothetical protein
MHDLYILLGVFSPFFLFSLPGETTADVELEDLWTLGLNILYPFIMDESELLNTAKLQSLLRPLCDLLTLPLRIPFISFSLSLLCLLG